MSFCPGWEPKGEGYDLIPARTEQLWIDLYKRGYIMIEDVTATQMLLGSLVQFWAQKHHKYYQTVVTAGPFSEEQLKELKAHSIQSIASSFQDSSIGPTINLTNALLHCKNSSEIEGVLYAHNDLILNVADLSQGLYPFPTNFIIENALQMKKKHSESYADLRIADDKKEANKNSYKLFPNGTFTDFHKNVFVDSLGAFNNEVPSFFHGYLNMENSRKCIHPKKKNDPGSGYGEISGRGWFSSVPSICTSRFSLCAHKV